MAPVTKSFNGNVAIPDDNPTGIQNTLVVDGVTAANSISKITVSVTITHTFNSDLDLRLIDPDGNVVELSQGNGDQDNNYTATIFDNSAPTAIAAGSCAIHGQFPGRTNPCPVSIPAPSTAIGRSRSPTTAAAT